MFAHYLDCQSGDWKMLGGGEVGGWVFVAGGGSFYGVGVMNNLYFSGTMKCRTNQCGGFGYVNCNSDTSCARSNGFVGTHYGFVGYTVGATNMLVSNAVKIW